MPGQQASPKIPCFEGFVDTFSVIVFFKKMSNTSDIHKLRKEIDRLNEVIRFKDSQLQHREYLIRETIKLLSTTGKNGALIKSLSESVDKNQHQHPKMMRIAVDIDGTITSAPDFFQMMTQTLSQVAQIHILTARDPNCREETISELVELGVMYDKLAITHEKVSYCINKKINVLFEDTDEYFSKLPPEVTVFKIREDFNFCWNSGRWIYSDKTGVHINKAK